MLLGSYYGSLYLYLVAIDLPCYYWLLYIAIRHNAIHYDSITSEECIESLNNSIKNREEGLILKDPYSTYIPNKRNGSGW